MYLFVSVYKAEDFSTSPNKIVSVYDPCCGTGGMLSIGKNWVHSYSRPHHLRGDEVSVVNLIKNFSEKSELNDDDWICQIHVTSPFLKIEHLESLREEIKDCKYDSIFSVDVIQNRFWRDEEYGLAPINHNPMILEQTQDLPKY